MNKLFFCFLLPAIFIINGCGGDDEGASRIVVGPSKVLIIPNSLQYQQGFVVQVTDKEGNPAPSSIVTIKMVPINYYKGAYLPFDSDGDLLDDEWQLNTVICNAEDINNNGVLDTGEDINNSGSLEPTNPATLDQHPEETPTFIPGSDRIITDISGFGFFSVTYPVSQANWVTMRITASTNVIGTEESETYDFQLFVALADVENYPTSPPGGSDSPYGTSNLCSNSF